MNSYDELIHQAIVKSPKYWLQQYHVLCKLDCEESVTESTQKEKHAKSKQICPLSTDTKHSCVGFV